MRRRWIIGVVAVLAAAAVGGTAAAKPLDGGEFHEEFNFLEEDFCEVEGLSVEINVVVDGRFTARTHGSDLVYFAEHLRPASTFTNTETDTFATSRERIINKDLSVVDNGDGTLTIILLSTGNATLYGPDGKAIGRNPGQVRFEFLIDHNGTPGDPSDDITISEELIKGSTGRSDDFCSSIIPALT